MLHTTVGVTNQALAFDNARELHDRLWRYWRDHHAEPHRVTPVNLTSLAFGNGHVPLGRFIDHAGAILRHELDKVLPEAAEAAMQAVENRLVAEADALVEAVASFLPQAIENAKTIRDAVAKRRAKPFTAAPTTKGDDDGNA